MFGHDKNSEQTLQPTITPVSQSTDSTKTIEPQSELTLPTPTTVADDSTALAQPVTDEPTTAPAPDPAVTDGAMADEAPAPKPDAPAPDPVATPTPSPSEDYSSSLPIGINRNGTYSNLGTLKKDALRELLPLISQLDQTPDEKYTTAKMIYEETNDQNILSIVYEAAKSLPDEKAKAEAIYDIIKKINEAK